VLAFARAIADESGNVRILHPCRNIALSMKDAPDVDMIGSLDTEHEMRIALQRPEAQAWGLSSAA